MPHRPALFAGVAVLVALWACEGGDAAVSDDPPPEGASQVSGQIVVEANEGDARPGGMLSLRFPQGAERGVAFTLEGWSGDAWTPLYELSAVPGGAAEGTRARPAWAPIGEGLPVSGIGVTGEGPDRVPVPEVADPGWYRVCSSAIDDGACTAPVEIVSDG